MNTNKQGSFVPLTGHVIEAPEVLAYVAGMLTVLVMNENYRAEIESDCERMGIQATIAGQDVVATPGEPSIARMLRTHLRDGSSRPASR